MTPRLPTTLVLVLGFAHASLAAPPANTLSKEEAAAGFTALVVGDDLAGWRQSGNWTLEDGVIARTGKGGSLVYTKRKVPDDFELRFEWKVAEGSNSGVYYRPGQYEYQILHNAGHSNGTNPRTTAASLYFCMAPSKDVTKPVGEWNTGRIVCQGTVIQHWLNGVKVVDFDYTDPQFAEHVELLRLRGGKLAARGANLSLQDHGDPVWYRNLRWRELGPEDDIGHETVQPAPVPEKEREVERKKVEGIRKRQEAARKKKAGE